LAGTGAGAGGNWHNESVMRTGRNGRGTGGLGCPRFLAHGLAGGRASEADAGRQKDGDGASGAALRLRARGMAG